jgi:hypothetical protein
MVAIPALHPGKAVVQIATFQVAGNDLLKVGPPEPVPPFVQGGEISQKPSGEEAMINPAEGALDLADSLGLEKFFGWHGRHPLFSMLPFSFKQMGLSN